MYPPAPVAVHSGLSRLARSALECGGLTPPCSLHPLVCPDPVSELAPNMRKRRQATALQGAFGAANPHVGHPFLRSPQD